MKHRHHKNAQKELKETKVELQKQLEENKELKTEIEGVLRLRAEIHDKFLQEQYDRKKM
jgi:hypothetical protein